MHSIREFAVKLRLDVLVAGVAASALAVLPVCAHASRAKAAAEEHAQTQAAADVLQQWYVHETGLYRTTGWWNSANAITTLANLSRVSHSTAYLPVFANTFTAAQTGPKGAPGFLNKYYDDEGWWALAWIDVYDLTGQPEYLRMADSIFADMQTGWDDTVCSGGVWWNKDRRGKNAIENELFLAVAAALANREQDAAKRQADLAWAHKEWGWFLNSGMINGEHLINDGLDRRDPAHCKNNGRNTWTYNQGVILGGLVELNKAAPAPSLPKMANAIAQEAIKHLADAHGVLLESALGQRLGLLRRGAKDVKGQPLRGFLAYSGQAFELIDEPSDRFGKVRHRGSPAGIRKLGESVVSRGAVRITQFLDRRFLEARRRDLSFAWPTPHRRGGTLH